jgi:transcriptional activator for dhaKLM operon
MIPTAYPLSLDLLTQLWQEYVQTGNCTTAHPLLPDPVVVRSWQRCALRFSPLAAPRLTRLKGLASTAVFRSQQEFVNFALPFLEDTYQFIEGSGCALLLADGTACVLELLGDGAAVEQLVQNGWDRGTYWAEGQMGTNAVGLCLFTAMPTQVVGAEHYFAALHQWVTTAAPIHAVNGRIAGVVAVLGPVDGATSHTISMVMAVARAITNQLQAEWLQEETNRHLSEMSTLLAAMDDGVLAWDEAGMITHINQQAGDMLHLHPASVTGQPVADFVQFPGIVQKALLTPSSLHDVEVVLMVGGRSLPVLVNLRLVQRGSRVVGYMLMIRPLEKVRQFVQQQMGANVNLSVDDFFGQSAEMQRVLRQVTTAARGRVPVLLRGEGGVGKNLMAQIIHSVGPRAQRPFLAVNCRAIPRDLMLPEFLGVEGSAERSGRPSKFELVDGGTLLLDQVEQLTLEMQAVLLHVIETRHVMRLESTYPIPVDVRIITTTAVDLEQQVADGRFLSQLYYRLGIFNLLLPPLRHRVEDIPLLVERFLQRRAKQSLPPIGVHEQALAVMQRYPWPGNVRELESVLELASSSCDGQITVQDLPDSVRHGRVITDTSPVPKPVHTVAEMEKEAILRAGISCGWHISQMAQQLGIGRTTLWRKMKRYNIALEQFKESL